MAKTRKQQAHYSTIHCVHCIGDGSGELAYDLNLGSESAMLILYHSGTRGHSVGM